MFKKDRKYYTKLTTQKLDSMNVEKGPSYAPTKKTVNKSVPNPKYDPDKELSKENQKDIIVSARVMQRRNVRKNIIKKLIKAGWESCEAFLEADIKIKAKEEEVPNDPEL